ncbi:MAG: hypothetical protein LBI60_02085 [Bacteroidales bacterium]|nr:hypothetical protein [Bacteroidales bacterium]
MANYKGKRKGLTPEDIKGIEDLKANARAMMNIKKSTSKKNTQKGNEQKLKQSYKLIDSLRSEVGNVEHQKRKDSLKYIAELENLKSQKDKDSLKYIAELENTEHQRKEDSIKYISEFQSLMESIAEQESIIQELIKIIRQQELNRSFLPFGIKQFKNKQKALGWTFLVSEVVVPVAFGAGFKIAANRKYDKHEKLEAQTLSEHKRYYEAYKNYQRTAIWSSVASCVGIYGINILCNYFCTKVKKEGKQTSQNQQGAYNYYSPKVEIRPQPFIDLQGNYGMGISMSINF